ncbi:polysaccharide deacetylase family protein [Anaerospora sp.]|uniref:polysaccharide deacetylase family protein n=1 Tax=Anaerospora sp. TaxID=1960278 RepID=UPI00289E4627|nr:polysaccharide deacetylase family protein [Anaerospora sp.]
MRLIMIRRFPQWYVFFATGIFLTVAMLAGMLQPYLGELLPPVKPQPISQGNTNNPKIAFACNVFWGEEFLPDMLNTLDKENSKITFFIGGSWAKRYPDLLKDIASRGHELGNHTYSHPHPNNLTKQQNQEQITRTEVLVHETTNIKTTLYAPPYGEYNDNVLAAAADLGYTTIMWSIDTIDWQRPPVEVLKNRVLKKIHNGAIILMHPTDPTAKALPELIKELKAKGYTITTVSDILN